MNQTIIQIGSHVGNTINDPIFDNLHRNTSNTSTRLF